MSVARVIELIQEDVEESVIDVCWADKGDLLAISEVKWFMPEPGEDHVLVRVFQTPTFSEVMCTEVSVPSTNSFGWTGLTGVRFNEDGSRICVDFHGVNGPPDHWAFAISVLDVMDGREIDSFAWQPPGAEAIMNSSMSQCFLIVDLFYFEEGADHGATLWQNFVENDTYNEIALEEQPALAPRLSHDENSLVMLVNESESLSIDLEQWTLAERLPASAFESTPVRSWSQSKRHSGFRSVQSTNGSKTYMFEDETNRVIVLESVPDTSMDARGATTAARRILLELPSNES